MSPQQNLQINAATTAKLYKNYFHNKPETEGLERLLKQILLNQWSIMNYLLAKEGMESQ